MEESRRIRICHLSRKLLLRSSCLWPQEGEEFGRSVKSCLYMVLPLIGNICFTLVILNHMRVLWKGQYSLGEDLSVVSSLIQFTIMYVMYNIHQKKIAVLLADLSNFDEFGEPENFFNLNIRHDFCAKFFMVYVTVGVLTQTISRFLMIPQCTRRGLKENCGFVSSSTPIVLTIARPVPFISYFLVELILIFIFVKVPLAVSYHLFEICQHIVLRINHLNRMVGESFMNQNFKARRKLNKCIKYHVQIIQFANRVNACFSMLMFTHLTLTAVVLGCLINHIVREFFVGFVPYVIGWCAAFFIACLAGQLLTDASSSIGEVAYNVRWYQIDVELQKYFILLIMRSQRPLYVSTGSFDNLSYVLFLAVMKTSYSVLTLLN